MGGSLGASTSQLGLVLGAFLVGAAVFQIPAGLAALRWGGRRIAIGGLVAMGLLGIASAFAPSWPVLAGLRFAAGAAAAFFFAPGLSLIAGYYPARQRGTIIGLYNGGFSVGGGLGIFAGALAGSAFGWPFALGVGGVAVLAVGLASIFVLPRTIEKLSPSWAHLRASAWAVLRSRSLWALSLAISGLWAALYISAQYFVQYSSEIHPTWDLSVAALLAAVVVLAAFPGGPVGGWLAGRGYGHRAQMILFTIPAGIGLILLPFASLAEAGVILAYVGLSDGLVFAILYYVPTYLPETRGERLALGVSTLNCIQIAMGSALAIAFGYVAELLGYSLAWIFAGVATVALLPLLYLVGFHHAREVNVGGSVIAPPGG